MSVTIRHASSVVLVYAVDLAKNVFEVRTLFGVGLITATAYAAECGSGVEHFHDSRPFAANIGTTPREHSSGEKRRRGAITKRGNPYLRKLRVQCKRQPTSP